MLIKSQQDVSDSCKGYQTDQNKKIWPNIKVTSCIIFCPISPKFVIFSAVFHFQLARKTFLVQFFCLSAVQDMPLTPATINPEQLHEKLPAGLLKSGNG